MDKILIVGINQYPGCPLPDCVLDAQRAKTFAEDREGADERMYNTVRLVDRDATTEAILTALDWLVYSVQPGDRLLFWYSGHGAQVPTNDPAEPDGLAEVICPVDFDWSPGRMITDQQFVNIFGAVPPGACFNWVSDSCHSGGLSRELKPYRLLRAYPLPPPAKMAARLKNLQAQGRKPHVRRNLLNVGYVSGCRSDQTSASTGNGGALTTNLLAILHRDSPATPLVQVVKDTAALIHEKGYDQDPQAEGARANCPFWG